MKALHGLSSFAEEYCVKFHMCYLKDHLHQLVFNIFTALWLINLYINSQYIPIDILTTSIDDVKDLYFNRLYPN